SIRARKWHAEPRSRTGHRWVGYAEDTISVARGRTATSGGAAALGMRVMPLAKTALGRERMSRGSQQEQRGRRSEGQTSPSLHPLVIPARHGKSPKIPYEISLSVEPWFGGS